MNGPHDLGGRHGFGPVIAEVDEPVFHGAWEGRALGLTLCAGALGHWTLDESRHARESLPPAFYLQAPYYDIWLTALERLLETHCVVSAEERGAGASHRPGARQDRKLLACDVPRVLAKGGPVERDPVSAPAYRVGDSVRVIRDRRAGHTRLPTYAMGREGKVRAIRGCHVYPDTAAHGLGEGPEWLYSVAFTGEELWGAGAEPGTEVIVDAFEPYLLTVDEAAV